MIHTEDSKLPALKFPLVFQGLRMGIGVALHRFHAVLTICDTSPLSFELDGGDYGEEITEVKFGLNDIASVLYFEATGKRSSPEDILCLIAIRVTPSKSNGLDLFVSNGSYDDDDTFNQGLDSIHNGKQYITFEFQRREDLHLLLHSLSGQHIESSALNDQGLRFIAQTLIVDSNRNRDARIKALLLGSEVKRKDKVLLRYPFQYSFIEALDLTKDLKSLDWWTQSYESFGVDKPSIPKDDAFSFVDIRESDRFRLVDGRTAREKFLNDDLMNLFSLWITRYEREKADSPVMIMSSFFYTTLERPGSVADNVGKWCAKQVVINPGLVHRKKAYLLSSDRELDDDEPALLYMDSAPGNDETMVEVKKNIFSWLNYESERLGGVADFDETVMKMFSPRVPLQLNGFDCGVYVIQYMLVLLNKIDERVTVQDVKENFTSYISLHPLFNFGQYQIDNIRQDMNTLILKLSSLYDKSHGAPERVEDKVVEQKNTSVIEGGNVRKSGRRSKPTMKSRPDTSESPVRKEKKLKSNGDSAPLDLIKSLDHGSDPQKFQRNELHTSTAEAKVPRDKIKSLDRGSDHSKFQRNELKTSSTEKVTRNQTNPEGRTIDRRNDSAGSKQDELKTPSTQRFLRTSSSNLKSREYNDYLRSKISVSSQSLPITDQPTKVAVPRDDPKISKSLNSLEKIVPPRELELIFQDGFFLTGVAKRSKGKSKNGFTIHFDYVSSYLPPMECTTEECFVYVSHYARLPNTASSSSNNEDPTLGSHRKWMYTKDIGEDLLIDDDADSGNDEIEKIDEDTSVFDENQLAEDELLDQLGQMSIPWLSNADTLLRNDNENEELHGIVWESNKVLDPPKKPETKPATLRQRTMHLFESPIQSLMAFTPVPWYSKVLIESNKYALRKFGKGETFGKFTVCDSIMNEINIHEIMVFHGILISMMLYPTPGRSYEFYWRYPNRFSFVRQMRLRRFKQIRSVLSFNSSDRSEANGESKDSLFKIRPILNMLKKTLGAYLVPGSDVSLDEATFGSRSSFGRFLIYFNAKKPKKFHYKIYALCCPFTNAMIKMRFATRDAVEKADPTDDDYYAGSDLSKDYDVAMDLDEEVVHDPSDRAQSKIDNIVMDMCNKLPAGTTVNSDNWYTSIQTAVDLKRKHGIFIRGTLRSNRKFIPKKLLFSRQEMKHKRGFRKVAVNEKYGITAVSWLDRQPVIMLSTADGTRETTVERREGPKKVVVPAPECIKNYNKRMGGVDRHDFLRSQFSLHSRHRFNRYYVDLYLCLLDIALTNAVIHYQLKNNPKNKKEIRANFLEEVAEKMLSTDLSWMDTCVNTDDYNDVRCIPCSQDEDKELFDMNILGTSPVKGKAPTKQKDNGTECVYENLPDGLSHDGGSCQICSLELRSATRNKVRVCMTHNVRVCFVPHRPTEDNPRQDWMCPNTELSCDQKFHQWYLPRGVYSDHVGDKYNYVVMKRSSDVAKRRKEYLDGLKSDSEVIRDVPNKSKATTNGATQDAEKFHPSLSFSEKSEITPKEKPKSSGRRKGSKRASNAPNRKLNFASSSSSDEDSDSSKSMSDAVSEKKDKTEDDSVSSFVTC